MDFAEVKNYLDTIKDKIIDCRREFHMYPELGFEEKKTSQKIQDLLKSWGIEVNAEIADTGVVGLIKGKYPGKTIALRVNMDALPIKEKNEVPYKSKKKRIMHASGHDGQMAMLLGAAHVLSKFKDELKGNVKLIFQPASEGPPSFGAKPMIEQGVLKDVDAIFGIKLDPLLETGKIRINDEVVMATSDVFEITLFGETGHASLPNKSVDAISMAYQVLSAFQYIESKGIDPLEPLLISVGTINGGFRTNAIAEQVTMTGTIRALSEEVRHQIHYKMENAIQNITNMFGGDYKMHIMSEAPLLINHKEMADLVKNAFSDILEKDNIICTDRGELISEDFTYYLHQIPGAFYWLGCGNVKKGIDNPWNHPQFDIDEDVLTIGALLFVKLAFYYLDN